MQKKLSYSFLYLSTVVFTTALLSNEITQEKFDKIYTTKNNSKHIFSQQITGLNNEQIDKFIEGKSFYRIPWVEAPSATTARDGLGPLFNANTCISCHPKNGKGSIYNENGSISRSYIIRVSIPSNGSKQHQDILKFNGFVSEKTYGSQISINGSLNVPFEAKPLVAYKDITVTYPDGEIVTLKQPLHGVDHQLTNLNYGKLHEKVSLSSRLAPALLGLGLLEQITDEQILANEDIDDINKDGISGKANIVYSPQDKTFKVGRYTYKASAPSVIHQSAAAANNDMSLTSPLFPNENCTNAQENCLKAPKGDAMRADTPFDLPIHRLESIAFYLKNLKIPKSTITEFEGEKLFAQIGCIKCHIPSFNLANSYKVKPFTDMLLHDMGEGLSDGRVEFKATEQEWRTAPLWGIGKHKLTLKKEPELLHDGRAKTIEEAILWHGGEALKIKNDFMSLTKEQRNKVINYIKEL
ncbi:MAG: thiol oxidoreductase [Arcobacteraceae bacterium]|nr:thiol oxidoreductase [Arcobacteraceae bacterium]